MELAVHCDAKLFLFLALFCFVFLFVWLGFFSLPFCGREWEGDGEDLEV